MFWLVLGKPNPGPPCTGNKHEGYVSLRSCLGSGPASGTSASEVARPDQSGVSAVIVEVGQSIQSASDPLQMLRTLFGHLESQLGEGGGVGKGWRVGRGGREGKTDIYR